MNVELFVSIENVLTLNEPERVHLFVIELKHPIFGFERSNIKNSNIVRPITRDL